MTFSNTVCRVCNDIGHVIDPRSRSQMLCPACGSRLLRRISRLPNEADKATFETLVRYPWIDPAIRSALEVVVRPVPNWWFTMEGAFGVGKTALMYAMCNYLMSRGIQVLYFRAFEAMQFIKDGFADNTASSRVEEIQRVPVLAMDEVAYDMSDYDAKVIADIMGYRYARGAESLTIMAYNPPMTLLPPLVQSRIRDARSQFFSIAGRDLRPYIRSAV